MILLIAASDIAAIRGINHLAWFLDKFYCGKIQDRIVGMRSSKYLLRFKA
jgi:hypothetical protein